MLIGVDLGNVNVKISEKVQGEFIKFPAKVTTDSKILDSMKDKKNLMVLGGSKCIIGEGEYQTDLNKLQKNMYKSIFLAALAKSSDKQTEEFRAVLGLPMNQYTEDNKIRLKKLLKEPRMHSVEFEGKRRIFLIKDIECFPESTAPYYGMTPSDKMKIKEKDLLLINMGGGNTNVAYFKVDGGSRKLKKSSTVMRGSLNLFSEINNMINGVFSLNNSIEDVGGILKNGLHIYGEKKDLSFTRECFMRYLDHIFKEINLYPLKTAAVMFTGGVSSIMKEALSRRVPGCLFQSNYMTATAEGLKKVGEAIWQEESH